MAENLNQINRPAGASFVYPAWRRGLPDRRRRPTPVLSRYIFRGQRRCNRRIEDTKQNYYVDRLHPAILIWALLVLFFSILDGLFTLYHLSQGAREANPLLNFFLSQSRGYFLTIKTLITASGLFILVIHQNFLRMRSILICLALIYLVLLTYQLTLLFLQS